MEIMNRHKIRTANDGFVQSFMIQSSNLTAPIELFDLVEAQDYWFGQMVTNGHWKRTGSSQAALKVEVINFVGQCSTQWLVGDNPEILQTMHLEALAEDGANLHMPWPDAYWVSAADLVKDACDRYMFERKGRLSEAPILQVIEELEDYLQSEQAWSPFYRPHVESHSAEMNDEDNEPAVGGTVTEDDSYDMFLALELTFIDGSCLFLTGEGAVYFYSIPMDQTKYLNGLHKELSSFGVEPVTLTSQ